MKGAFRALFTFRPDAVHRLLWVWSVNHYVWKLLPFVIKFFLLLPSVVRNQDSFTGQKGSILGHQVVQSFVFICHSLQVHL